MKTLKDSIRKRVAEKHLGREMIGVTAIRVIRDHFSQKSVKSKVYNPAKDASLGTGVKNSETLGPDEPYDLRTLGPEDFLDKKYEIQGYVKFDKIFIKTTDQSIKIEIFKSKKEILIKVNEALAKLGYSNKMKEIMTK